MHLLHPSVHLYSFVVIHKNINRTQHSCASLPVGTGAVFNRAQAFEVVACSCLLYSCNVISTSDYSRHGHVMVPLCVP